MPTEAELKKKLTPGGGLGCGWYQWGVGGSSGVWEAAVGCGCHELGAGGSGGMQVMSAGCRQQQCGVGGRCGSVCGRPAATLQ